MTITDRLERWFGELLEDLVTRLETVSGRHRRGVPQQVIELLEHVLDQNSKIRRRLERLEHRMAVVEDQAWNEVGRLIGLIVAEQASLREGLAQKDAALRAALAELESADADAAAQVQEAVDADSAADAERLTGLIDQLKAALPAQVEVPDVPVPPVGEPAEEPEPAEPVEETPAPPVDEPVDVVNPTDNPDDPSPSQPA